jgi:hypothetical protein
MVEDLVSEFGEGVLSQLEGGEEEDEADPEGDNPPGPATDAAQQGGETGTDPPEANGGVEGSPPGGDAHEDGPPTEPVLSEPQNGGTEEEAVGASRPPQPTDEAEEDEDSSDSDDLETLNRFTSGFRRALASSSDEEEEDEP